MSDSGQLDGRVAVITGAASGMGERADIAGAALWLAGDDSRFVSGQSIAVNGALLAAGPRIFGRLRNTRNVHRVVGMAHGTNSQPAEARRL